MRRVNRRHSLRAWRFSAPKFDKQEVVTVNWLHKIICLAASPLTCVDEEWHLDEGAAADYAAIH